MTIRWDATSHQAFGDYLKAVVGTARMAGQAAGQRGWDHNATRRDLDEALHLMEEREDDRTVAFERLRLVADKACIDAANHLNLSIWQMEWLASGREAGSADAWRTAVRAYLRALDDFHAATRDRLSILVPNVEPRSVADVPPALPVADDSRGDPSGDDTSEPNAPGLDQPKRGDDAAPPEDGADG
jgi:hypothetical protein